MWLIYLLFLIGGMYAPGIYAQRSDTISVSSPYVIPVHRSGTPPVPDPLPFRAIRVLDARFDTAKVGYMNIRYRLHPLTVKGGLSGGLSAHFQTAMGAKLSKSDTSTLLIVVRRLWLKDWHNAGTRENKIVHAGDKTFATRVNACLEIYRAQDTTYIPLFRLDSLFFFRAPLGRITEAALLEPFYAAIEKAGALPADRSRRMIGITEWNRHYEAARSLTCLTKAPPAKGIYRTYKDFVNNTPWDIPFTVERDNQTSHVMIEDGGRKTILRELWGYSDGKQVFIQSGFSFYRLKRTGDAFEFYGSEFLTHHFSGYDNSVNTGADLVVRALQYKNKHKEERRPLQIDMESGRPL
ncbi:MAG TPA: hypothetical protein VHK69_12125 [Chitinophagaceae bacterium]|jgi:hypothetical protein|nr:hypothetical protein [Chitinophagaceae bacterium]